MSHHSALSHGPINQLCPMSPYSMSRPHHSAMSHIPVTQLSHVPVTQLSPISIIMLHVPTTEPH